MVSVSRGSVSSFIPPCTWGLCYLGCVNSPRSGEEGERGGGGGIRFPPQRLSSTLCPTTNLHLVSMETAIQVNWEQWSWRVCPSHWHFTEGPGTINIQVQKPTNLLPKGPGQIFTQHCLPNSMTFENYLNLTSEGFFSGFVETLYGLSMNKVTWEWCICPYSLGTEHFPFNFSSWAGFQLWNKLQ